MTYRADAVDVSTASKYRDSLDMYTASLNKNPFDPIVWSNRGISAVSTSSSTTHPALRCPYSAGAAVRLKLEEHGLAIADASEWPRPRACMLARSCAEI